jgi:MYXO-CTERM domain-containing protein
MRQPAFLVVVFAASLLLPESHAQACSGSSRGNVQSRLVMPADAAVLVPTNAQIVITYLSVSDPHPVADQLALKTSAGATVPITVSQPFTDPSTYLIQTVYVLKPTAPLQPNTKYLVFSEIPVLPCDQNAYRMSGSTNPPCTPAPDAGAPGDAGIAISANAVSSFTTGSGPDDVPPVLTGDITQSAERQSCSASACCGPYDGYSVSLSWSAATDSIGPVFYELSFEGSVLRYPIQTGQLDVGGNAVSGAILCSGKKWISTFSTFGFEDFQGPQGNYTIVAVDLAGNRSQPLTVNVTVDCSVIDGGVPPPDAPIDTLPPPADGEEVKRDAAVLDASGNDLRTIADVSPSGIDMYSTPDHSVARDTGADGALFSADSMVTPDVTSRPDVVAVADDVKAAGPDAGQGKPDAAPSYADAADTVASNLDTGCSCRLGRSSDHSVGVALLTLGLALLIRHRRRQD